MKRFIAVVWGVVVGQQSKEKRTQHTSLGSSDAEREGA